MISIMQKVSNRIWLPYQAALEYHKRRITVIQQQSKAYDEILKIVKKEHEDLQGQLNKFIRHPSIQIAGILEKLKSSLGEIEDILTQLKNKHPDLLIDDPIQAAVLKLFDGKVGNLTSDAELLTIYKQGEERYRLKIPPGYEDKEKGGTAQYSDLVIWFQVIAKAKENKLPMILVTDDRKDDWWLKIEGKTIGPHPELVQEISTQAGVTFYMYSADPFMKYAGKYLKYKVEKKAINEVREVRQGDEILRPFEKREALMRSLMGSAGSSGSATDEIIRQFEKREALMRSLMGSAGSSGSATDEILRQSKREALMRSLMGSAGSSGSATDEIFRQFEKREALMQSLMGSAGSSGSATDEIFRQAKVAEKPAEIDISDMGKKDK